MNSLTVFSQNQKFRFSLRVTAAFLLAVIAWGGTVEISHGHSAPGANPNAQKSLSCVVSAASDCSTASVQQNSPIRSSSRPNASSECLICQLHHNLATTLLSQPASVDTLHQKAANATTPASLHILEFTTVQHGRAPPVIL